MSTFYLWSISIFFYSLVFFRKNISFGFKENFLIGFFFYIHLPLLFLYFGQEYLIEKVLLFDGYNKEILIQAEYLSVTFLISFFIGYYSLKKRIIILNLHQNFSIKEIIIASILIVIFFFQFNDFEHINFILILFILLCLLIVKLDLTKIKIIFYLIFLLITFQFLMSDLSGSRRDIIKLFFIFLFFLCFGSKNRIFLYSLFMVLIIFSIFFIFILTYERSKQDWDFTMSTISFVRNYDFMTAFDNFLFIIKNNNFLYGNLYLKFFILGFQEKYGLVNHMKQHY